MVQVEGGNPLDPLLVEVWEEACCGERALRTLRTTNDELRKSVKDQGVEDSAGDGVAGHFHGLYAAFGIGCEAGSGCEMKGRGEAAGVEELERRGWEPA